MRDVAKAAVENSLAISACSTLCLGHEMGPLGLTSSSLTNPSEAALNNELICLATTLSTD